MNSTLLVAGLVCVIAAIIGGGLEWVGIKIPGVASLKRQLLLGSFGIILIFAAYASGSRAFSSRLAQLVSGGSGPSTPPNTSEAQQRPPRIEAAGTTAQRPVGVGRHLLWEIEQFNKPPAKGTPYGWDSYVEDVGTLYRRAMSFHDLLAPPNPPPSYEAVGSIYSALDEAADELSERGRQMHNSTLNDNDSFDRHLFVGPGWFRLYLEDLRRVHVRETNLNDRQVESFGKSVDYWKRCQSGIEQGQNCNVPPPPIE